MQKLIFGKQNHTSNIVFIDESFEIKESPFVIQNTDGLITKRKDAALVIYGADCAILAFWDGQKIGVCHAGWRGLLLGIIEKMISNFNQNIKCHIGPFSHKFEIQKDSCYEMIFSKFGDKYFSQENRKIFFNFKQAILDRFENIPFTIDDRNTFDHYPKLGSWRASQN